MTPAEIAILLFVVGVVLLVGELFLPTAGIVGVIGVMCIAGGVIACFFIGQWTGLAALLGVAIVTPFASMWFARVWPKTIFGRHLVLRPTPQASAPNVETIIDIGKEGVTISELRPMGVCEFGPQRVEAVSEIGIIPAGRKVRVVNIVDRRPTVRAIG